MDTVRKSSYPSVVDHHQQTIPDIFLHLELPQDVFYLLEYWLSRYKRHSQVISLTSYKNMLSTVFVLSSTTNRRPFPTAYILCPISISQDSLREKIVILQVKMTQWMVQMAKLVCPSYCLFFFDLRHIINSLGSSNCS